MYFGNDAVALDVFQMLQGCDKYQIKGLKPFRIKINPVSVANAEKGTNLDKWGSFTLKQANKGG